MLPRTDSNPRRAPANPSATASPGAAQCASLPGPLRPRWRRACVHHPEAAAFTEDCLDVWFSHLYVALDAESCGCCTCGCCVRDVQASEHPAGRETGRAAARDDD